MPTPGNLSLIDKTGEWTIAQQGQHQAKGPKKLPDFGENWIYAGIASYGYGCACVKGVFNTKTRFVISISSIKAQSIKHCLNDASLPQSGRFANSEAYMDYLDFASQRQ